MLASAAVSTADQLPMTDDSPEMMACPECAAPTTCLLDDKQGNRVLVSILLGWKKVLIEEPGHSFGFSPVVSFGGRRIYEVLEGLWVPCSDWPS